MVPAIDEITISIVNCSSRVEGRRLIERVGKILPPQFFLSRNNSLSLHSFTQILANQSLRIQFLDKSTIPFEYPESHLEHPSLRELSMIFLNQKVHIRLSLFQDISADTPSVNYALVLQYKDLAAGSKPHSSRLRLYR